MIDKKKAALVLVTVLVLGGCGMKNEISKTPQVAVTQETSEEEIQSQFTSYLKETYGDIEYEIQGIIYSGLGQSYDLLNGYSKGDDGLTGEFAVRREEAAGKVTFEDTYQSLLLRSELEERVRKMADSCFSEYQVFADTSDLWLSEMGKPDLTLDQAVKNGENLACNIWVVVSPNMDSKEAFQEEAEKFCEMWKSEKIGAYFSFFYLEDGVQEKLTRDNYAKMLEGGNYQDFKSIDVRIH